MVGSQLAEWSLLIPDVRGSNPVTNKFMINIFTVNCWKDEHKEKKAENGQFYKITIKRFYQDKESNHQEKKRERKKLKKYFCVICIGLTCLSKTNIWSWTAKEEGFDQGSQLFNRIKASSSLYFLSYYLDKNIPTEICVHFKLLLKQLFWKTEECQEFLRTSYTMELFSSRRWRLD